MAYPVLADVKTELGLATDFTDHDARITSYLTAAVNFTEEYCNRYFIGKDYVRSYRPDFPIIDRDGTRLHLRYEALSVRSVKLDRMLYPLSSYSFIVLESWRGIKPYTQLRIAYPSDNNLRFTYAKDAIEVDATWGYTDTADTPPDIKLAIVSIAAGYYRRSLSRLSAFQVNRPTAAFGEVSGIPPNALVLLAPYRRG